MSSNSTLIDADALDALRLLLIDTDRNSPTFPTDRLTLALRDNRRTVLFRDPGYAASGVNPYLWYRGKTHVPESDPDTSQLISEQDKRNFQAPNYFRHWDSNGTVQVWVNGVLKTISTDYTVDYAQGRVTFTADVNDWQAVNVTASYFRIYHAARSVLLWRASQQGNNLVSWTDGDGVSEHYGSIKEAIAAMDAAIGEMTNRNVRFARRMY